jgi:ubiquinone/menaquinone biosynthesis C-methylase UbiE
MKQTNEAQRILQEYRRRERELPPDFYSLTRPGILFTYQQRVRATLAALAREGLLPLSGKRILEVGCGTGGWLVDFESWGAERSRLAGIDLDPARAEIARRRLAEADIRVGDAASLPWPAGSFDIVLQSTVLSSILDQGTRRQVAAEMVRVLAPSGVIVWYDFFMNNPSNPNVRGVRAPELRALFPGFRVALERVTLAPPLARRLAPLTWLLPLFLERLRVLNSHYLGVLRRS